MLLKKKFFLKNNSKSARKIILDSCGLIDGRIVELVSAGFTPSQIVIPQFILKELQLLADGNDSHKRARARFGLDVAKRLQTINTAEVTINRQDFYGLRATDDKLVELAKKISADLYTTDYNLNKVANVEGVRVLNVNELALSLRPLVLPGESIKVKIVQKGSGRGQGVGYLDDGTMVVVDNAIKLIGKTVEVQVDRYHQTESGKMLFATTNSVPHQKNR
ncbi:TRAM domain-containing protein [Candidatus Parcubacteria bacterium]|nr:TRAM domain-containing protein [Candidatus Parcubacteria bacterium]